MCKWREGRLYKLKLRTKLPMKIQSYALVGLAVVAALGFYVGFVLFKPKDAQAVCLDNLRQIGQAVQLYADDNSGFLPPYLTKEVRDPESGKGIPANPARWVASLAPFVSSRDVFFCPATERKPGQSTNYETTGVLPKDLYGKNFVWHVSLSKVEGQEVSYVQDRLKPNLEMQRPDSFLSGHGTSMNVLLYDGSVKSLAIND